MAHAIQVRRAVRVGIAVVVDIAEVRGVGNARQPPVVAAIDRTPLYY